MEEIRRPISAELHQSLKHLRRLEDLALKSGNDGLAPRELQELRQRISAVLSLIDLCSS